MRTGVLEAVALLALGTCLHVCKAQNTTTQTLFQYLTALEQNRTFFYEPANAGYYASINNNTIIEFNGTFYEDFNGTFYALQRQANGSLIIPANATAIVESGNADGQSLLQLAGSTLRSNTCCGHGTLRSRSADTPLTCVLRVSNSSGLGLFADHCGQPN